MWYTTFGVRFQFGNMRILIDLEIAFLMLVLYTKSTRLCVWYQNLKESLDVLGIFHFFLVKVSTFIIHHLVNIYQGAARNAGETIVSHRRHKLWAQRPGI